MVVDVSSGDLTIQIHTHLHLEVYSQKHVKRNRKQVSKSKTQNDMYHIFKTLLTEPTHNLLIYHQCYNTKHSNSSRIKLTSLNNTLCAQMQYTAWNGCWFYFRHVSSQHLTIIEHQKKKNLLHTNLTGTKQPYTVQY
jgi:hypothetical protein